MKVIFYYSLLFFVLIFNLTLLAYFVFGFFADLAGAPFVPTKRQMVNDLFKKIKIKKGQKVVELGSGDGRVVRTAVKLFNARGVGIEINPLLVFYSRILAKIYGVSEVKFIRGNLFQADLKGADIIFLFLLPKTLQKLSKKLLQECDPDTLVISHGFLIKGFEKYLVDKIDRPLFSTYLYRINQVHERNLKN